MTAHTRFAIGVDIGGSHVTAAAIDLERKEINYGSRTRMRVNAQGVAADILHLWEAAIRYATAYIDAASLVGVGIAMPGPFDYKNGISLIKNLHKYDSLYGINVCQELSRLLHMAPSQILFKNDAGCFLLGEVMNGAARDCRHAMGLTLGTGFGSAFYEDGHLEEGTLYHEPFRDMIAEEYLSTRWFVKRYRELSGRDVRDVKELVHQIRIDHTVQLVFEEFGTALAEFLLPRLAERRPEVLVIGGNIVNTWDLFIDPLLSGVSGHRLPTRIVKSSLGENANLLGAAGLLDQ